jgi:hypothetical protein
MRHKIDNYLEADKPLLDADKPLLDADKPLLDAGPVRQAGVGSKWSDQLHNEVDH